MLITPWLRSVRNRRSQVAQRRRLKNHERRAVVELLEARALLVAPQFVSVSPNVGDFLQDGDLRTSAPSELLFQFSPGQDLNDNTIAGAVQVYGAGHDSSFTPANVVTDLNTNGAVLLRIGPKRLGQADNGGSLSVTTSPTGNGPSVTVGPGSNINLVLDSTPGLQTTARSLIDFVNSPTSPVKNLISVSLVSGDDTTVLGIPATAPKFTGAGAASAIFTPTSGVNLQFIANQPGEGGNDISIQFNRLNLGAASRNPIVAVVGKRIEITLNENTTSPTTAQALIDTINANNQAGLLISARQVSGTGTTDISGLTDGSLVRLSGADRMLSASTTYGLQTSGANASLIQFLAKTPGIRGGDISVVFQKQNLSPTLPAPQVSVSGNQITVRLNTNSTARTKASDVVAAINAASTLVSAALTQGDGLADVTTVLAGTTIQLGGVDAAVSPGYIGEQPSKREVIYRFGAPLTNDDYRIQVIGTGTSPLRNAGGEILNAGADSLQTLTLDLGPVPSSVVPQPVLRQQLLTVNNVSRVNDGDTITVDLGTGASLAVFEFNDTGSVRTGNTAIVLNKATDTPTTLATKIAAQIATHSGLTATSSGGVVTVVGSAVDVRLTSRAQDTTGITQSAGGIEQRTSLVNVYFNDDDLTTATAQDPRFYQLVDSATGQFDLPTSVSYNPTLNLSTLTFSGPLRTATYELRVGTSQEADDPAASAVKLGTLFNGSGHTNVAYLGDNGSGASDVDFYEFDLVAGGNVMITTTAAAGSTLDTKIRLLKANGITDETGTGVTSMDQAAGAMDLLTVSGLSGSTKYYVAVSSNSGTGSYQLNITTTANLTNGDNNSSFASATNLGNLGTAGTTISSQIERQTFVAIPSPPGTDDEPGHRNIPVEGHGRGTLGDPATPPSIPVNEYYFPNSYGSDPQGNLLFNQITEGQKDLARFIFETFSRYSGVQFRETANRGLPITTGDIRAAQPGLPINEVAGLSTVIINAIQNGNDNTYAGGWMGVALHEIGHALGLSHSTDLPSFMNGDPSNANGGPKTETPSSDYDLQHLENRFPKQSTDIDLYAFNITSNGNITASILAKQQTPTSTLDAALTLYKDPYAVITSDFGTVGATTLTFTSASAGVFGNDIRLIIQKSDFGVAGAPTVSVSGHDITVVLNTNSGNETTASALKSALDGNANSARLITTSFTGADGNLTGIAPSSSTLALKGGNREVVAANDDYNGYDPSFTIPVTPGRYFLGVSAKGNNSYDPTVSDSGLGGQSEGTYQLDVSFAPDVPPSSITDTDQGTPTLLDGDHDGVAGGTFRFWFESGNTIFVDKATSTPTAQQDGSAARPYSTISAAVTRISRRITIPTGGPADIADGEYFVLNDGSHTPRIFEFDTGSGVVVGNIAISLVGLTTQADVVNAVRTAINAQTSATFLTSVSTFSTANGTIDLANVSNVDASAAPSLLRSPSLLRIIGNGGNDNSIDTPSDARPYVIGVDNVGATLADGRNLDVPQGVTLMIDAGAVIKLQSASIDAGTASFALNRQNAATQLLGTARNNVYMTSYRNDLLGGDTDGGSSGPSAGNWQGLVLRQDSDLNLTGTPSIGRDVYLNSVYHADLSYGGGLDVANNVYDPIFIIGQRPTVAFTRITNSAAASISATPNSFEESRGRVGPDIHNITSDRNSVNGLFVKVTTEIGKPIQELSVNARFTDTGLPYVVTENLILTGNAGGMLITNEKQEIFPLGSPNNGNFKFTFTGGNYNASTTLTKALGTSRINQAGGITAGTTSIVVADASVFHAVDLSASTIDFYIKIDNEEIAVRNVNTTTNTLTVTRGQNGTAPAAHADTAIVHQISVLVGSSAQFPTPDSDPTTIDYNLRVGTEDLAVRGINGTTLFVNRGANGTTPGNHAAGSNVALARTSVIIPYNADAAQVQAALEGLNGIGPGGVKVTDGPLPSTNMQIEFTHQDGSAAQNLLQIDSTALFNGVLRTRRTQTGGQTISRPGGRLAVDENVVIKLGNARIEGERGLSNLIAEGSSGRMVVFTSVKDDRFGGGGTFDTTNDGFNSPNSRLGNQPLINAPQFGDWGGLEFQLGSRMSLDYAYVAFAGGQTPIEGGSGSFNAVELHEATGRISNSIFENNDNGVSNGGPDGKRSDRESNVASVIFVRGSQPVVLNNVFRSNKGAVISIDANAMKDLNIKDPGRATGLSNAIRDFNNNQGPLVRLNRMSNDTTISGLSGAGTLGMQVRGGNIDTQTVWDDTDIVHVLTSDIIIDYFHTSGGLTLQSAPGASLVVKLSSGTDFTIGKSNLQLIEIPDRIGPSMQIIGQPGFPVVLTSISDDTVGASLDPNGFPQKDTNGNGSSVGAPGQWGSIQFDKYANDTNMPLIVERENGANSIDVNGTPSAAQVLGNLAKDLKSANEVRRSGFTIKGTISEVEPGDVDVYSFTADPSTEVWFDIDKTDSTLDTVLELVDISGNVLARSQDNTDLAPPFSVTASSMREVDYFGGDYYATTSREGGMRLGLPSGGTYYVRVRSNPAAGNVSDLQGGLTSGHYQLQIRLQQRDQQPGVVVDTADIRYATNGIVVTGLPYHSPLTGEAAEAGNEIQVITVTGSPAGGTFSLNFNGSTATVPSNATAAGVAALLNQLGSVAGSGGTVNVSGGPFPNNPMIVEFQTGLGEMDVPQMTASAGGLIGGTSPAVTIQTTQNGSNNGSTGTANFLGNIMKSDRANVTFSGSLAGSADIDYYRFQLDYQYLQEITGSSDAPKLWPITVDLDWADGLTRPDTSIAIFDAGLRLIYMGRASNVQDDQAAPGQGTDTDDLTRGSAGTLDPFIGSIELPATSGTYYLAVYNNQRYPKALEAHFQASTAALQRVRLEPVNSVRRIAEDHIGFVGYESNGVPILPVGSYFNGNFDNQGNPNSPAITPTPSPTVPLIDITNTTTLTSHIKPLTFEDLVLYVGGRNSLGTNIPLNGNAQTVPSAGLGLNGSNDFLQDIAMRSDGILYGYERVQNTANTAGRLVILDLAQDTGVATPISTVGLDNIPSGTPPLNSVPTVVNAVNRQFEQYTNTDDVDAMAWRRRTTGSYDLFYAVREPGVSATTGGLNTFNTKLYQANPTNGSAALDPSNSEYGIKGDIQLAGTVAGAKGTTPGFASQTFVDAPNSRSGTVVIQTRAQGSQAGGVQLRVNLSTAANSVGSGNGIVSVNLQTDAANGVFQSLQTLADLVNGNGSANQIITVGLTGNASTLVRPGAFVSPITVPTTGTSVDVPKDHPSGRRVQGYVTGLAFGGFSSSILYGVTGGEGTSTRGSQLLSIDRFTGDATIIRDFTSLNIGTAFSGAVPNGFQGLALGPQNAPIVVATLASDITETQTTFTLTTINPLPTGLFNLLVGDEMMRARVTGPGAGDVTVIRTTSVATTHTAGDVASIPGYFKDTLLAVTTTGRLVAINPVTGNGVLAFDSGNQVQSISQQGDQTQLNGAVAITDDLIDVVDASIFTNPVPFEIQVGSERMTVTNVDTGLNQLTVDRTTSHTFRSTVSTLAVTAAATTITVADGTRFTTAPFSTPFIARIDDELIHVTSVVGNTLNIGARGVGATSPASHNIGSAVYVTSATAIADATPIYDLTGHFTLTFDSGTSLRTTKPLAPNAPGALSLDEFQEIDVVANSGSYSLSFVNDVAYTTALAADVAASTSGATGTITVQSNTGSPTVPFIIRVGDEDMRVTNKVGTTWTVTRGINGTPAIAHQGATTTGTTLAPTSVIQVVTTMVNTGAGIAAPVVDTLAAGLATGATTVTTSTAIAGLVDNTSVLLIDGEQMLVTAGSGTTSLTVTRGRNGTSNVGHGAGATITLLNDVITVVDTTEFTTTTSPFIRINDEEMRVVSVLNGTQLSVLRASNGTVGAAHLDGATVYRVVTTGFVPAAATAAQIDTALTLVLGTALAPSGITLAAGDILTYGGPTGAVPGMLPAVAVSTPVSVEFTGNLGKRDLKPLRVDQSQLVGDEIDTITLGSTFNGGEFDLSFVFPDLGTTVNADNIDYDGADLIATLDAALGVGNYEVVGGINLPATPLRLQFTGRYADQPVTTSVTSANTDLRNNEIDTLTIVGGVPSSGTFNLVINAGGTPATLTVPGVQFNEPAVGTSPVGLQNRINSALVTAGIGATVTVTGGPLPTFPFTITFDSGGAYDDRNITLSATGSTLNNSAVVAFATTIDGATGNAQISVAAGGVGTNVKGNGFTTQNGSLSVFDALTTLPGTPISGAAANPGIIVTGGPLPAQIGVTFTGALAGTSQRDILVDNSDMPNFGIGLGMGESNVFVQETGVPGDGLPDSFIIANTALDTSNLSNVSGPTIGLAFSPLDINLWHPTGTRAGDLGHGINTAPDATRTPSAALTTLSNGSSHRQSIGGQSMYFGLDGTQHGVLNGEWSSDLLSNPLIRNRYNLPGGAFGRLQSNSVDLSNYKAEDQPVLYFSYFLQDGAPVAGAPQGSSSMRDAARVQASSDGGRTWQLLATNNAALATDAATPVQELGVYLAPESNLNGSIVQQLFSTSSWRQARIDMSPFAGKADVRFRFDFSTSGSMNENLVTDNFGTFLSTDRGANNNFEGFYIDDIILGFAERGEMVTAAPGDVPGIDDLYATFRTSISRLPDPVPSILTAGQYQVEIRPGTIYADPVDPSSPEYNISQIFDTNDRMINGQPLQLPASTQTFDAVSDDDSGVPISDFMNAAGSVGNWSVTNQQSVSGINGFGSAPVTGIGSSATEVTLESGNGFVSFNVMVDAAVNPAPNILNLGSDLNGFRFYIDGVRQDITLFNATLPFQIYPADGSQPPIFVPLAFPITAGTRTLRFEYRRGYNVVFGNDRAYIDNLVVPGTASEVGRVGDQNVQREQGMIVISNNIIRDVLDTAIEFDAGARDAQTGFPYVGPIRSVPISNPQNLVTSALISNNVVANFGTNGITFSGDANTQTPRAATPMGKIVNNTIYGRGIGTGINVNQNTSPTIFNNIIAETNTGILVNGATTDVTFNHFYLNGTDGVTGTNATRIPIGTPVAQIPPLFVSPSTYNFYLKPSTSTASNQAIDSSLDVRVARTEYTATTRELGIEQQDMFAPDFDAYGQKRIADTSPTSTFNIKPIGVGSSAFRDRGAIERADFNGPIATITVPLDQSTDDKDPDLSEVSIADPALLTSFVVSLTDPGTFPNAGVGVDDALPNLNNGLAFTLTQTDINGTRLLIQNEDYTFAYNANTNQAIFTSVTVFPVEARYNIRLDQSGIQDVAANPVQPNRVDGTTQFDILVTNAVNDPPVVTVPSAPPINENTSLSFSTASGRVISVSDPDAFIGSNRVQVTLNATKGTITLPAEFTNLEANGDLTLISGADGSATVTIEGTIPIINRFLANTFEQTEITDGFELGAYDSAIWANATTTTAKVDNTASNLIGAFAAHLDGDGGGDQIVTRPVNLSSAVSGRVDYKYQRGGKLDLPETGDDLFLEFSTNGTTWTQLDRIQAGGIQLLQFGTRSVAIPTSALTATTQFRFRSVGTVGADDWFVDDFSVISARNQATAPLTFAPTTDHNSKLGLVNLEVVVDDLGNFIAESSPPAEMDSANIVIPVLEVNTPPSVTVPTTGMLLEDTTLTFAGSISVSDSKDGDFGEHEVTVSATNGTITLNAAATGALTSVINDGSKNVVLVGTIAQLNAALNGLVYDSDPFYNGSDTISVTINDQGNSDATLVTPSSTDPLALSDTDSIDVTITAVNNGPENRFKGSATFPGASLKALERTDFVFDAANTEGGVLSVFDVDTKESTGLVKVTVEVTTTYGMFSLPDGTLTLNPTALATLGGGVTFNTGTGVADTKIEFIAPIDDVNSLLDGMFFTPDPNITSVSIGHDVGITITVDDQGATGLGGSLTDTDSLTLEIQEVNDAPIITVTNTAESLDEDGSLTISAATSNTITVAESARDIAPTGDLQLSLSVGKGVLSLPSGIISSLVFTYTDTFGTGQGSGTNDPIMVFQGSLAEINSALDGLVYTPDVDFNGSDTLTITLNDRGQTGAGGAMSDTKVVALTIRPTNDKPSVSAPTLVNAIEDTTFTSGAFSFTGMDVITISEPIDGDNGGIYDVTLEVTSTGAIGLLRVSTTAGATVADNDTSKVTVTGTITQINAAINGMLFQPPPNDNIPDQFIGITVDDNGNDDFDFTPELTGTASIQVIVDGDNDGPVISIPSPASILLNEDMNAVYSKANSNAITITDIDAGAGDLTLVITSTNGQVAFGTTSGLTSFKYETGKATAEGNLAALNSALDGLTFDPTSDFVGTAKINISVNDNGNTGRPMVNDPKSDSKDLSVTYTPLNDAPTITPQQSPLLVNEDSKVTISSANNNGILVGDVDIGTGQPRVTMSVSKGKLTLSRVTGLTFGSGTANGSSKLIFVGSALAPINAAIENMVYQPNDGVNGSDLLVITVDDQGFTGPGPAGVTTVSIPIDIQAINDAPVLVVPSAQSTNEDTGLVFSSGKGNAITISDVDVNEGTGRVEITLAVTNGVVNLGTASNTVITAGANGSSTVTFNAAIDAANVALSGLTYVPTAEYSGSAKLDVTVSDLGNRGTGNVLTASKSVSISVAAQNDAPVNTVPTTTLSVSEDNPLALNGINTISVSDVDSGTSSIQVTLTATNGKLSVTPGAGVAGNNSSTVTLTGSTTSINSVLSSLVYLPNADFNGSATITVATNDNGFTGGAARTDSDAVAITVISVNDLPVGVNDTYSVIRGNTLTTTDADGTSDALVGNNGVLVNDTDVDTARSQWRAFLSVPPAHHVGSFTLNQNGTFNYIHDGMGGSTDTFTYQIFDGVGINPTDVTVTININDAPVITDPGTIVLNENASVGTTVVDINATDANAGNVIAYSLVAGNTNGAFSIDSTTGVIRVANASALNFEVNPTFTLTVQATDNATTPASSSRNVLVNLNDLSEAVSIGSTLWTNAGLTVKLDGGGTLVRVVTTGTDTSVFEQHVLANVASLSFTGRASANDRLTIDFTNGNPIPTSGLSYNGGTAGNDSLELVGGSGFDTIAHNFASASSGSISLTGGSKTSVVNYSGLEPIVDSLGAANRVFTYGSGNDTVTLRDGSGSGDGRMEIVAPGTGESVEFSNPTASLTIALVGGNDVFSSTAIDSLFSGSLTILAGDGNDNVTSGLNIGVSVDGGTGDDVIIGGNGADSLQGASGKDTVNGGAGNDVVNGGANDDRLSGGLGDDEINGQGSSGDVLVDTVAGVITLTGSIDLGTGVSAGTLASTGQSDVLTGIELVDITGSSSADTINFANWIVSSTTINGGDGDDIITGSPQRDEVKGGLGNDRISGGEGKDALLGGDGNDVLAGNGGDDVVEGEAGNDTVQGGAGNDTLSGGSGADLINGQGSSNDLLRETLDPTLAHQLVVNAATGRFNYVYTSSGSTVTDSVIDVEIAIVVGGDLSDRLDMRAWTGLSTVAGGAGNDVIFGGTGLNRLNGNAGNDKIVGNSGVDQIFGDDGDDSIDGGAGNDALVGGLGNDTINGRAGNDKLYGEAGTDILLGGIGNDVISGGDGNDQIVGEAGDDTVRGDNGSDTMTGGGNGVARSTNDLVVADPSDVINDVLQLLFTGIT